ncbi:MAG: ABC transporter ATP-binding protein [Alphaproteobacteria bacterium]|uniref:ABC transporter ATP-binding protein n=1 Tax=Candidatus Nitrobium versatile TaxID=2884831 RepID=A0A953J2I0_9BACT|nr:ABC transporter ATP-binding protein [Candidatus Nitrobium versatile]
MPVTLLGIRNLSVLFKTDRGVLRVVSGLSLEIGKAEVFGLVGESGCGKSLTALSLLGILPHNAYAEGEILFNGKNLLALSEEEMRRIRGKDLSMVFQEPMTSLNPVLTIGYQVAEALQAHFDLTKRDALDKAVELLRAVRIPSPELRIKDYPHQMSGGMRQRVMIAIAIACNPSLLIADEPTTALDVTIQAQILELLKGLRKQRDMAVLLITHDLSIISEQADRVAIMYAGQIVELAGVEALFRNPLHPYTIGLLNSLPVAKGTALRPISGFVPTPDRIPEGCRFSDRCPEVRDACRRTEQVLEEIEQNHFVRCMRCRELWKKS